MTKIKEVAVEQHPDKNRLSEIYQNNQTEFALCRYDVQKDRLIQCHQFVHCRDFMLDALVGVETHKDMGIYSFRYGKDYPRPEPESCSVMMKLTGPKSLKNLDYNFHLLTDIENFIGWSPSYQEMVEFPDKDSVVVWVLGNKKWQQSAISFSLYTYLLKCLTYEFKDSINWKAEIKSMTQNVEAGYMDIDYLNFLFKNLDNIVDKYTTFSGFTNQADVSISTIHNSTGFVSMKRLLKPTQDHLHGNVYKTHVLLNYQEPK